MARANNERDVANYRIGERNSIEVRPIPHMLWFSEEWRGGTGGDRRSHYSVSRMLKSVVAAGRRQGKNL